MKKLVAEWTLVILAIVVGSCLVSMMVLFMGGGVDGAQVGPLLQLQLASVPVAVIIVVYCVTGVARDRGWRDGFRDLWTAMPQWLVFIFLLLNAVAVSGLVANMIVVSGTADTVGVLEYAPLFSTLTCSLAYLLLDASLRSKRGGKPALAGRWP